MIEPAVIKSEDCVLVVDDERGIRVTLTELGEMV